MILRCPRKVEGLCDDGARLHDVRISNKKKKEKYHSDVKKTVHFEELRCLYSSTRYIVKSNGPTLCLRSGNAEFLAMQCHVMQ